MPVVAEVGEPVQTRGEATFEWKLNDFFSLSKKIGDYYLSGAFPFAGTSWCMKLFPNGHDCESSGEVGVYLVRKETGLLKRVSYSFNIKGDWGKSELWGESDFTKKDDHFGFARTCSRSHLEDSKSILVPKNVLTVTCDLRNNARNEDEDASSSRVLKVIDNMKTILAEGKRADFKLKLGGREFLVHKVILESRCKYFENMFRHQWIENTVGEVQFEDIEEDALESILHFIYTGDVEDMSSNNVCEIYVAAHKFLLEDLKSLCIGWMEGNLCLGIVCKVLVIADRYEEKDLNECAIQYFIEEAHDILGSEEWKQLKKDHVSVVADLLEETTKRELDKQRRKWRRV